MVEGFMHGPFVNQAALPDPSQNDNRRSCQRSTTVRFLARPHFLAHRASVFDVSSWHIGLLTEQAFEAGTVLAIQLQTKHAGISGILSAQVLSVSPQADGYHLLDCRLSRNLTEDEQLALV
jgi:hypothetical protein